MSAVRALVAAVGLAVALVATGCGGGNEAASTTTSTSTTTTSTPAKTTTVRVYFLRNGQVWPVAREIAKTQAVATAALDELLQAPTTQERTDLKLRTAVPDGTEITILSVADGVATIRLKRTLDSAALAQIVYTLTQFPTVKKVALGDIVEAERTYGRTGSEEFTPPILVESPLSGETVSSPIRVTGTANTFEATFQYELRGPDEKILSKHFEMATSGSGTRGTFDFSVPYTLGNGGPGKLVVYEDSAENGARIHVQEIPLVLSP